PEFLESERWVTLDGHDTVLDRAEALIAERNWSPRAEDRRDLLDALEKQLRRVSDNDFDLSRLEANHGLHELRPSLRWFMIEAQALNGFISFRPDSEACPAAEYSSGVRERIAAIDPGAVKYLPLPESSLENDPCRLSRCLYEGIALAVTDLGAIKDQV